MLSLSNDPGSLAFGPQLAIFAAAQGIPTALIIAQQDAAVTASLRTACAAPPSSPKWPQNLRVLVSDGDVERAIDYARDAARCLVTLALMLTDGLARSAPQPSD